MIKREVLRKQNTVFEGKIITVRNDEVLGTTGRKEHREVVLHRGGVGVLPIIYKDNVSPEADFRNSVEILLVRQYRYCFNQETLEIPAGKLEDSTPLECGIRELEEETGAKGNLLYLGRIMASPGFSNEIIHLYMADNLSFVEAHPDEGEEVETVSMLLSDALSKIDSGEIFDSKTVTAILLTDRLLAKKFKTLS